MITSLQIESSEKNERGERSASERNGKRWKFGEFVLKQMRIGDRERDEQREGGGDNRRRCAGG